jgi:hypothetical protein
MNITLVKKILGDGNACKKCIDVEKRLHDSGQIHRIDNVIIADERDPASEGMRLAQQHHVKQAPFFIVEKGDGKASIYTVYFQFVKEVLQIQEQTSHI